MSASDTNVVEQLDVIRKLCLLRCLGPGHPEHMSTQRQTLSVLNWLAGIFAGDDPTVSAAIAVDLKSGRPFLNVVLVPGSTRQLPEQRTLAQKFIAMVQSAHFAAADPNERYTALLQITLQRVPARLQSDIDSIWKIDHPSHPTLTSDSTPSSLWPAWLDSALRKQLNDTQYPEEQRKRENEQIRPLLEKLYTDMPRLHSRDQTSSDPESDEDKQLADLQAFFELVTAIISSGFARNYIFESPNQSTYEFGLRLRRILTYQQGCQHLARAGTRVFGQFASDASDNNIAIRWVNDVLPLPAVHGERLRLEVTSAEYIQPLLQAEVQPTGRVWDYVNSRIASGWNTEAAKDIIAATHPEAQLVAFLVEKELDAHLGCIGTTSPVCWACYTYMSYSDRPNDVGDLNWAFSDVSRSIPVDWVPPSTPEGRTVLSRADSEIKRRIQELVQSYLEHDYPLESSK